MFKLIVFCDWQINVLLKTIILNFVKQCKDKKTTDINRGQSLENQGYTNYKKNAKSKNDDECIFCFLVI